MAKLSQQQLEQALNQFQGPLIGYAMGFLKDQEKAKDVVQETFIKLSKQPQEKVEDGLKTWLFTVCRNASLDVLRKDRRLVSLDGDKQPERASFSPGPDAHADLTDRHQVVLQHLAQLSENQQEVIRLKYQQELSYREIAGVTGLKEGNVGFLLHTGLKRLRELLPDEIQPERAS